MIKTMLLTAQLALSPIVGTNGLQPKRLPNPVYGETTNLKVSWNGKEYERSHYSSNDYIYNKQGNQLTAIYLYPEGVVIDGITSGLATNIPLITESQDSCTGLFDSGYFYSETQSEETNYYLRFLWGNDYFICMLEVFESLQGYNMNLVEYEVSSSGIKHIKNPSTISDGDLGDTDVNITSAKYYCLGSNPTNPNNLYTAEKWQDGITKLKAESIAPWEAESIPNPSVYDNIYNFYYQNLFANEALDEVGAQVGNNSLTMRQWLAHTATIVSITLLAAALVVLVIKVFKLIAGSISDIWG